MTPVVLLLVGIVPALLLMYGLTMAFMRRDFSQVLLGVRNCNFLLIVSAAIAGTVFTITFFVLIYKQKKSRYAEFFSLTDVNTWSKNITEILFICGAIFIFSLIYKHIINRFFLAPLTEHKEWLMDLKLPTFKIPSFNSQTKKIGDRGLRIVIDKPLPSAEVIDDIARWEKLRDEGRITKDEFDEIRIKILQRI